MPTTTHDTAAALEAAIDAHGANASGARAALHRAITAHVEAEVAACNAAWQANNASNDEERIEAQIAWRASALRHEIDELHRRLAAAPDVEQQIDLLRRASYTGSMVGMGPGGVRETTDRLRAAIAADKTRAVAATISPAVHELRNALPPVRHHAQRIEPGDRREAILRGVDRALAVADELAAVLDGGPARVGPTPDEARRLVEALRLDLLATADTVAALHGAIGTGLRNHCVAAADKLRLTADTARAALLRALGVEA